MHGGAGVVPGFGHGEKRGGLARSFLELAEHAHHLQSRHGGLDPFVACFRSRAFYGLLDGIYTDTVEVAAGAKVPLAVGGESLEEMADLVKKAKGGRQALGGQWNLEGARYVDDGDSVILYAMAAQAVQGTGEQVVYHKAVEPAHHDPETCAVGEEIALHLPDCRHRMAPYRAIPWSVNR